MMETELPAQNVLLPQSQPSTVPEKAKRHSHFSGYTVHNEFTTGIHYRPKNPINIETRKHLLLISLSITLTIPINSIPYALNNQKSR